MNETSKRKTNLNKLKRIIKTVDDNHRPLAENIFERLQFMVFTLSDLEKQIEEEGAVIKNINGNGFETVSEHPAQKSYNTMIGRYNALIKTFIDIIPDGVKQNDEFLDFVGGKIK